MTWSVLPLWISSLGKVLDHFRFHIGYLDREPTVAQRFGGGAARCYAVARGNGRRVDLAALPDKTKEFSHDLGVGAAMSAGARRYGIDLVPFPVKDGAFVPESDDGVLLRIAVVLDAAFCADDGIVAPIVGRIVSLLVTG